MSAKFEIPDVCFMEDVARALRTSLRTIKRMRRFDSLPIPELPAIDRRPRWSGRDVREFINNQVITRSRLRRAS